MQVLELYYTIRVTIEDSDDFHNRVLSPISDAIKLAGGSIKEMGFQKIHDEGKIIELNKDKE